MTGGVAVAGGAAATTGRDGGITGTPCTTGAIGAASGVRAATIGSAAGSCLTVGSSTAPAPPHTPHVVAGSKINRSHFVHRVIHTFPENTGVRSRGGKGRTGSRAAEVPYQQRSLC